MILPRKIFWKPRSQHGNRGTWFMMTKVFADIIADLERMYNVNIRVTNENIRNLKVRTSFQREDGIEQALQILCILTDTKLEQSAGIYILQ